MQLPLLKVYGSFLFRLSEKTRGIRSSVWVFFAFLEVRRGMKYCLRGKFSFLNVDIWFDVTKCKFIAKNSSFELLVVFPSIFVADTKITFFYNFVAPLIYPIYSSKLINHDISNVMYPHTFPPYKIYWKKYLEKINIGKIN